MHYTIFNCSPNSEKRSSSACIANWLKTTLESDDYGSLETEIVSADIFYLNKKKEWDKCSEAFYESENAIFVLPLYVEGVPGIFLEFLDRLDQSRKNNGIMSFVLQGGFEEASQLRTAEKFLQTLPSYFNCQYGGTLLRGGMFGMAFMRGDKFKKQIEAKYIEAFQSYKNKKIFDENTAKLFAGKEHYSKSMIVLARLTKPLNRIAWSVMGKKLGAIGRLSNKPYPTA